MKKNTIDELFKERFRQFEEIPDDKVWKAIEASLNKKKSRKVIPIWWKFGGIAAAFAILFFAINPFEKNTQQHQIEVTETGTKDTIPQKIKINATEKKLDFKTPKSELVEKEHQTKNIIEEEILEDTSLVNTNKTQKEDETNTVAKKEKVKQSFIKSDKNRAIVQEDIAPNIKKSNTEETKTGVAKNLNTNKSNKDVFNQQLERKEAIADKKETTKKENSNIDFKKEKDKNEIVLKEEDKSIDQKEAQKKSIFDEIKEQKEETLVAVNTNEKWSLGPSVAPVYFNGIGEGSPVHTIFVPNSKSGNVNMSYGVSVAYEVNKKLKVRSGMHKVDYGYTTNQVAFSPSARAETPQVENINYAATAKGIVVSSKVNTSSGGEFTPLTNAIDTNAESTTLDGNLSQQFGYLEVPLELNYSVLDKRFGINIIGGISSLFLIDNAILLNSGDQTTQLGEANNINDLNFSTNFGFGLNYKFSPKLQFNIEPIFKYQLNTFSNVAGDFRPFSVGVYSGFSLRF